MILLEIAAQGMRGLALPGGRATLRPGYNVLAADGAPLRRLIEALLWPDARDAESMPKAAPGPGGAGVRGGLTLVGNDGVTYRLVRDLTGGCQLHRFDDARRSFSLVAQDLAGIAAYLRSPVGVPARSRFTSLLALSASELPSKQPASGLRPGGAPAAPVRQPLTGEQAQKRIAALKVELGRAQVAEKLQYQLDGLQTRLFKLEEELRAEEKIRHGLEASRAALAELGPVEGAVSRLGDVDARLAAFEKASSKREEALERVAEERRAIEEEAARGSPAPFWKRPSFLAGVGVGVLALAASMAAGGSVDPGLRYVALLGLPAFGYAAWEALHWVADLEVGERAERRHKLVEERERKVAEQYERETGEVKAVLKTLGLSSLSDLREALGRLADARSVAAEWQGRLEELEARPESRGAREQKAAVQAEIQAIEENLSAEAGGYVREPRSIEAEISRIESEASAPPAPAPAAPAAAPPPSGDPVKGLLERAAPELSTTPAGVVRGVQKRLSEVVALLSAQRISGCLADDRGNLVVQTGGRATFALSLPVSDRDLVFAALKIALMEQAVASGKSMAFADDALAALPDVARRAAARILKQAAHGGQLIHATGDPLFREAADHAA